MTFSNRREPTFGGAHAAPQNAPEHAASHNGPHIGSGDVLAHKVAKASGLTRMVSSVQIIGSLLAVPLGLASGYSMYKTTFAVDATCQNLRSNIVAMLDKNVDAATRRMLVRRDVSTFEQTCGSFDPDAHAAFKTLLAVPPAPAATAAAAAAPKLRSALPATEVARKDVKPEPKVEAKAESKPEPKVEAAKVEAKPDVKPEARPAVAEKAPAVVPQAASLESIEREAAVSDTRWLAAVRQALVTNNPEAAAPAKGSEPAHLEVPVAKPAKPETVAVAKPAVPPVQLQPTWNVPAQVPVQTPAPVAAVPAQTAAPALGAPTDVAPAVAAAPTIGAPVPAADSPSRVLNVTTVRDDAPRPPAAITGPTPINGPTESDDSTTSRIGSWIAQIPLVGRVIEPRQ